MDGNTARCGIMSQDVPLRYKLEETLGIGSSGKVMLAVHTLTGLKVAIKILDRQTIDDSEAGRARTEINIMRQLFHPHIVRLFEVIDTPTNVYIVMEYMESGELYYYIKKHFRLHEDEARHLFQQIISGVQYCHHHMIVHRDLKLENLILDSKHNVKIVDFGLGYFMRDGHFLNRSCGSPNYAAPELICRQLYAGPEVDVWSCGVILYALLCGRLPFVDDNLPGLYAKIKSGLYPVGNHLSESAQDLISRILVVDPMKRISIPEICRHPWFMTCLPPYIANPSPDYLNRTEKFDIDVVNDMVQMGFNGREVIGSLQNHLQNEATVTYTLLLHSRLPVQVSNHIQNQESSSTDNLQTYSESVSHGQSNWSLGLKSQASPGETIAEVLDVFQGLNVKWKRIGSYNMKCLWSPPASRCSISASRGICIGSGDDIKFEIQVIVITLVM